MDKMLKPMDTPATIMRSLRGKRSLRELAAELGVSHQVIALWESGDQAPSDNILQSWWDDPRPWVKCLARDVLIAKFVGLPEVIEAMQAAPTQAPNGK